MTGFYGEESLRDKEGYDKNGFDENGFDSDGFNIRGFNKWGFDKEGFDKQGFNIHGLTRGGHDRDGFDRNGYDRKGFDREGYDRHGFDEDGYDVYGYDKRGFNRQGYDRDYFDWEGFNKWGYDREGFNRDGFDKYHRKRSNEGVFNKDVYNYLLGREFDEQDNLLTNVSTKDLIKRIKDGSDDWNKWNRNDNNDSLYREIEMRNREIPVPQEPVGLHQTIFRDDPDAVTKLEVKIKYLEDMQNYWKEVTKFPTRDFNNSNQLGDRKWYELSAVSTNLREANKKLEDIKAQQARGTDLVRNPTYKDGKKRFYYSEEPSTGESLTDIYDDIINITTESIANEDMKWWECNDCNKIAVKQENKTKHEKETDHTMSGVGMQSVVPTFLRKSKSGEGNIYWDELGNKKVIDKGSHFETEDGDTIFWTGQDAVRAQNFLRKKAKESFATEYGMPSSFDLNDKQGKSEMLMKVDVDVQTAKTLSNSNFDDLPQDIKGKLIYKWGQEGKRQVDYGFRKMKDARKTMKADLDTLKGLGDYNPNDDEAGKKLGMSWQEGGEGFKNCQRCGVSLGGRNQCGACGKLHGGAKNPELETDVGGGTIGESTTKYIVVRPNDEIVYGSDDLSKCEDFINKYSDELYVKSNPRIATEDDYNYDFNELTSLAQDKILGGGVNKKQWDDSTKEQRKDLEERIKGQEICRMCNKRFGNKTALQEHILRVGPHYKTKSNEVASSVFVQEDGILTCKKCGYKTIDQSKLNEHRQLHGD